MQTFAAEDLHEIYSVVAHYVNIAASEELQYAKTVGDLRTLVAQMQQANAALVVFSNTGDVTQLYNNLSNIAINSEALNNALISIGDYCM